MWSNKKKTPLLFDMLNNFYKDEIIDDFQCENCNQKTQVNKAHRVVKFPSVLVILIKRF